MSSERTAHQPRTTAEPMRSADADITPRTGEAPEPPASSSRGRELPRARPLDGVRRSARRTLRYLRYTPDRLLHALRRWRARARARRTSMTGPVVFICHGNICRSPYAAAAFLRLLGGEAHAQAVGSAGFIGSNRPSPAEAIAVASRRGLDLRAHRSSPLTRSTVDDAGLLVVMAPDQRRALLACFSQPRAPVVLLGDFDPEPIDRRAIRDPVAQDEPVFEAVYTRIDRCLASLVQAVRAR